MALPKIQQPLFNYTLPVSGIDITFRPFLVSEEKILLAGKEGDPSQQLKAMEQVIGNVVQEDIDLDELTMVDIEMLFIQMRSKSVQNLVKLKYRDTEDDQEYDFNVDLDTLEPTITENRNPVIDLDGNISMELKDPTFGVFKRLGLDMLDEMDTEMILKMISGCIVSVWDKETVYDSFSEKDALEFLQGMDTKRFEKISEYFEGVPKLKHTIEYENSKGSKRKIDLEGLADFF